MYEDPYNLTLGSILNSTVLTNSKEYGASKPATHNHLLLAFPPREPLHVHNNPNLTNSSTLSLVWQKPNDTQGAEILDYKVYWRASNDDSNFTVITNVVQTNLTISREQGFDIVTGQEYEF